MYNEFKNIYIGKFEGLRWLRAVFLSALKLTCKFHSDQIYIHSYTTSENKLANSPTNRRAYFSYEYMPSQNYIERPNQFIIGVYLKRWAEYIRKLRYTTFTLLSIIIHDNVYNIIQYLLVPISQ